VKSANYTSLSSATKLPPKNTPSSSTQHQNEALGIEHTSNESEYQALGGKHASTQYQSLDELSRC
jgi:hypothetical protein